MHDVTFSLHTVEPRPSMASTIHGSIVSRAAEAIHGTSWTTPRPDVLRPAERPTSPAASLTLTEETSRPKRQRVTKRCLDL